MEKRSLNTNQNRAKKEKKDEFYTQVKDIEDELRHYKKQFKNKVVFCNCDDPRESNFVKYFSLNFEYLGLKKLIATHYNGADLYTKEKPYKLEYNGDLNKNRIPDPEEFSTEMIGTGDFKSEECIKLLKSADIIVTNPPFSLFRDYVVQLMEHKKKFLILGNQSAIVYKGVFDYVRDNKMWLGYNNGGIKWFEVPEDYEIPTKQRMKVENGKKYISMGSVMWFTNLSTSKRHEELFLYKKFNEDEFPKYDNYDAIEVKKFQDIPMDYRGVMGVPITFLDRYNPEQFEIVGSNRGVDQDPGGVYGKSCYINGKEVYKRLFIRNKSVK